MRLTERQLNRATLARQLLLEREPMPVVDAVRRIVAIQAQEPPSPFIALWNRIDGFDPADLDRALAKQQIVKATLMRITLHAVAADDYPAIHEAMQQTLRAARLNDRRFRSENVPIEDVEALVPDLLSFASAPRQNREMEAWLEERFGAPKPRVWWALRQYGPIVHATTGGPWAFGPRPSYVGAKDQGTIRRSRGVRPALVRRYLEGFGPATMPDIAQFSTIVRPPIQEAIDALGDGAGAPRGTHRRASCTTSRAAPSRTRTRPPRRGCMAMWDSTLLAYADRARMMPPDVPQARDPDQRRRPADDPRRRARGRRLAPARGRDRGHGVPSTRRRTTGPASSRRRTRCGHSSPSASRSSTAGTCTGGTTSRKHGPARRLSRRRAGGQPGQQRLDRLAGQRTVEVLADPGLVVGAVGVGPGDEPAAAALLEDVGQLGDRHREVRRRLDPAGAAGLRVRVADRSRTRRVVARVLDEDAGELLRRVGEAGVVEVEDAQPAVRRPPDVVGPEVAMAGPEGPRRPAHPGVEGDELRHQRVQLVGERGTSVAEPADPLAPGATRRPASRTRVVGGTVP